MHTVQHMKMQQYIGLDKPEKYMTDVNTVLPYISENTAKTVATETVYR